jgi:membrane protease YdiL (CAAX protease family)
MIDFYTFLKNPVWFPQNMKPDPGHFLKLFIFYLIALIPLALLASTIISYFGIVHKQIEMSFVRKLFLVCLIAPIYEEVFFRSLLKFTRLNIILFITNLTFFIIYTIVTKKPNYLIFASMCLIVIIVVIISFSAKKISKFISENIKYFFYLTSFAFGMLHAVNFTGSLWALIAFSVALGGPQIIAGLILGYIRIKYGLIYCILFHMFVNSTVLLN